MANNEILNDLFFIERGYLNGNHFVYFNGKYELKYKEIMNTFFEKEIIKRENEHFFTTVKP